MANNEPAKQWTEKAILYLLRFTMDKTEEYGSDSGFNAGYFCMYRAKAIAQEEGSPCVTADMVLKTGKEAGWEPKFNI